MAGDWIKMRSNLWDDPRVGRLCDLTDQSEAAIIGGLYWLWSAADQHSADGHMPGLSLRGIDRKTGIIGFGSALCEIGWIQDTNDGITITRFDDHNGSSAKRRCMEAQRKATSRNVSASDADKERTGCVAREREEKEIPHSVEPSSLRTSSGESSDEGHVATAGQGVEIPETPETDADWLRWFNSEHGLSLDPTSPRDRKAFMPLAKRWVNAGITLSMMRDAIQRAYEEAREPIAYLPGYADRVLASMTASRSQPNDKQAHIAATVAAFTGGPGAGTVIEGHARRIGPG